ncbi:6946_t:CDS:2, partial [Racocetra persica]
NEGPASAKVQDVDMTEAVEGESEETSNLTEEVRKLSVDDGRAISQSKTKSMESEKVQCLIKELSMSHKPIDDNDSENKTRKSKPKTLLQLYYNASRAEKYVTRPTKKKLGVGTCLLKNLKKGLKKLKMIIVRFNDQQARAKTRNIYKLFGESYDPETKT